jgi:hypothetical protein
MGTGGNQPPGPEERAWVYELRTLRHAHESGTLAGCGIGASMIKDALKQRRSRPS